MLKKASMVPICFIFLFTLILSACGSIASDSDMAITQNSAPAYDGITTRSEFHSFTSSEQGEAVIQLTSGSLIQQKLVYRGDLNIETKEFDQTINTLLRSLDQAGGYIVSQEDSDSYSSQYTRIDIRIPSQSFYSWVEGIEEIPDIKLSKHIYTDDVSEEYVDLQARLHAKQLVIDKYLEYMELATTADELIRFTNELANLQAEVESFQARIRYLDHQVNYSSLSLRIKEVKERAFFEELQMGRTLKGAIENGLTGFIGVIGFLVSAFIVLLPFIIIAGIVWYLIYVIRRNLKSHRAPHHSDIQGPVKEQGSIPHHGQVQQPHADDSDKEANNNKID